jgi:hypothetical protein
MRIEFFQEHKVALNGWEVNVSSYRLGTGWHAKAENSASATMCRTTGLSRDEAESKALQRAEEMLGRTTRLCVA